MWALSSGDDTGLPKSLRTIALGAETAGEIDVTQTPVQIVPPTALLAGAIHGDGYASHRVAMHLPHGERQQF